jgi:23S rRNA (pseudouridine1915-N3)-methyltransferase
MHKITLLCMGSLKSPWAADACTQYTDRLRGDMNLEIVELPASKERDPERQLQEESSRLLDALEKRTGSIWVLDERGKSMTSQEFSGELSSLRDAGQPILFVIGGAFGLSDAVRNKADYMLQLSSMTLPHELCRAFFLEQLYRAMQIQKESGYHH